MLDCKKCADSPVWFCANCGKNLYEFNPDYPAVAPHVAYGSLYLRLEGGYGMFFDTDFTTQPDVYGVYLCHDCGHTLAEAFPFVAQLTKHEHFEDYV